MLPYKLDKVIFHLTTILVLVDSDDLQTISPYILYTTLVYKNIGHSSQQLGHHKALQVLYPILSAYIQYNCHNPVKYTDWHKSNFICNILKQSNIVVMESEGPMILLQNNQVIELKLNLL